MTVHEYHDHEHDHDHEHHDHAHHDHMDWGRIQAWVQTGIMFLMGLYFIDLALPGGNLGNYINANNFGWLTWVGAFILLAIAMINVTELLSKNTVHAHNHDPEAEGHQHARAGSLSSWVFLGMVGIPLVFGLGMASRPLGAEAISSGQISSDIKSIGFTGDPTTVTNPENRTILDWVRSFAGSSDLSEFEGQEVSVIGFVYHDARFASTNDFMVVRFTLSCCVADARPIGLMVANLTGTEVAQDTWVEVTGHFEVRSIEGVDTPVIVSDSVSVTDQPEQPYLYF